MGDNRQGHIRQSAGPRRGVANRFVSRLVVVLGAMTTALVGMPLAVGQEVSLDAFSAGAIADATRTRYSVHRFAVVEDIVDVGGTTAQATLDGSSSRAFAALPDPGSAVIAYNTVVGLALGQGVPVDYPFYAESVHPGGAAQEVSDPTGAYVVSTEAGSDAVTANAQGGSEPGDVVVSGSRATATVTLEDDALRARAQAVTDAVSFNDGELVMRGIRSTSETVLRAGGEPETVTSFSVGSLEANGMRFGYDDEGVRLIGTAVPLPRDDAEEALDGALEPLGLTARFTGPTAVAGGARSAVLELQHRQSVPSTSAEAVTALQLGGTTTFASGHAQALTQDPLGSDQAEPSGPVPEEVAVADGAASPGRSGLSSTSPPRPATTTTGSPNPPSDLGVGDGGARPVMTAGAALPGSIESLYVPLLFAGVFASLLAAGWMRRMMIRRWAP